MKHNRLSPVFTFLLLVFALACTLTDARPATPTPPLPRAIQTTSRAIQITRTATPAPTCIVNASTLNLRACAGTHCSTLAWLDQGDVLTITDTKQAWFEVVTHSQERGWVHSKFCTGE